MISSYGISDLVTNWLENFLSNRSQQVIIENMLSSSLPVTSGVPQGSVIGPLLFVLFFNDITRTAGLLGENGGICLFADDAKLFSTDMVQLQNSLNDVTCWLKEHQLEVASNKCFVLKICKPRVLDSSQSIFIQNDVLQEKPVIKDLGIFISNDLKWAHHINYLFSQASVYSYQVLHSFKSRNIWTLIKLYKTYIRPKLEYNTPVWSPYLQKDICKVEQVQRNFTKRVCIRCNIPFNSYSDRLYKLNLHSLEYRRIKFDIILIFKIINGFSDLNFHEYFVFRCLPYNFRGNSRKIETIKNFRSDHWKNSFFVRASNYWNRLPDEIASSPTLCLFLSRIKKFDLNLLLP